MRASSKRSHLTCALAAVSLFGLSACKGWDPREPFTHDAPEVDAAIDHLEASRFDEAASALEGYLGTGACSKGDDKKGTLGLPDSVRAKPAASFDLGLTLFHLAESFGDPFGKEGPPADPNAPKPPEDPKEAERSARVDCALILLEAIGADPKVPTELRARAQYLAGNLEFLRKQYEAAIKHYDEALRLVPGIPEDAEGDGLGRDAANNRAIAQRRLQEQKEQEPPPEDKDKDKDKDQDQKDQDQKDQDQKDQDQKDKDQKDQDQDQDKGQDQDQKDKDQDQDQDKGQDPKDQDKDGPKPQASPEPAAPKQQDDRVLDGLEQAPSYQQEQAKQNALRGPRATMEDK